MWDPALQSYYSNSNYNIDDDDPAKYSTTVMKAILQYVTRKCKREPHLAVPRYHRRAFDGARRVVSA